MKKIIVTEFITLDGVIEAPGGDETDHPHGGWQMNYKSPEVGQYKVDELNSTDGLLLGRNTFSFFQDYWPNENNPFADRMNSLPKYVVSQTLKQTKWNNSHILRDLKNDLTELKKTGTETLLVYGSGTLAKGLLEHNLIDELRMIVYPVSVGGGLKLFDDKRGLNKFQLKNSQILNNGILILEFTPTAA